MHHKINLTQMLEQIVQGGCWVINDAAFAMKNYAAKNNLDLRQYRTPQKYIKQGEELIIVSVSKESWAGIKKYSMENVIFREKDDSIVIIIERRTANQLISPYDYEEDQFVRAMTDTGPVSKEEYDFYLDIENQDTLPLIEVMII